MRRTIVAAVGAGALLLAGCGSGGSSDQAEVVEVVETAAAPTTATAAGGDGELAAARMLWVGIAPNGEDYLAQAEAVYPLDTMGRLDATIAAATGACLTRGEMPLEAAGEKTGQIFQETFGLTLTPEQAETITSAAWETVC